MGAHEFAHVERREALEQAVPDERDQRGRDQQLRKARERVVGEFAALDRALSSARMTASTRAITSR